MGDDQIAITPTGVIISDASVLIDYYKVDVSILSLISRYIGAIVIPRQVFEEIEQIDETEAKDIEISIVEPGLAQLDEASVRGGPLSRKDKLILIMARDNHYICWTNDLPIRKRCLDEGIRVFWGLEIMLPLCKNGHLLEEAAIRTGRKIQKINRLYITDEILERFEMKVISLFERR